MDRSEKIFSSPPTQSPVRNQQPPVHQANNDHSTWQSVERASFEKALDRIRAQDSARPTPEMSAKTAAEMSSENVKDALDSDADARFGVEQGPAMQQEVLENSDLLNREISNQKNLPQSVSTAETVSVNSEANLEQGLTLQGAVSQSETAAAASPSVGGDIQVSGAQSSSPPAESTTRSNHLDAARVSDMIRSLENMPGTPSGQWTFGVLGNSSGIVALHLQRVAAGGWQVNVSVDEAASFDGETSTEELKKALTREGHDIESIKFSYEVARDESDEAPNDVNASRADVEHSNG